MGTIFQASSDTLPHITYLGKAEYDKDWKHFYRENNEFILFFMCSGRMYLSENNTHYELKPGDVLLLEPGLWHCGYKTAACSYYFAHFTASSFQTLPDYSFEMCQEKIRRLLHVNYSESPISDALYRETALLLPKMLHIDDGALFYQILRLLEDAIKKSRQRQVYYKPLASCHMFEALSLISNTWIDLDFSSSRLNISSVMFEKVNALLNYLHSSYHEKITGEIIEQKLSINFDYLNRIFKKRTGNTIFSYLHALRIDRAKQLLLTTALPLQEIAAMTGFSDEYYFNRSFKKTVGTPPSKYRNRRIPDFPGEH